LSEKIPAINYLSFFYTKSNYLEFYKFSKEDKKFVYLRNIYEKDLFGKDINGFSNFSNLIPLNDAYIFFERGSKSIDNY